MAHSLHFPIVQISDLINPWTRSLMKTSCTPLGQAHPGDLLGFSQDIRYDGNLIAYSICQFLICGPQGGIVRVRYDSLPEEMRPRAAHLAATAHNSPLAAVENLRRLCDRFNPGDGEPIYLEAMIFDDLALLMVENLYDEIYDGRYLGEEIDQEILREAFTLIVPHDIESSHARLALAAHIPSGALDALNAIVAVPGEDGNTISLTLPTSST